MSSRLFPAARTLVSAAIILHSAVPLAFAQTGGELFPNVGTGPRKNPPKTPATIPAPPAVTPVEKKPTPAATQPLLDPPILEPEAEPATGPAPAPAKIAPPAGEVLAAANKLVDVVFAEEIAQSKTPAQKSAIARKILATVDEEKSPAAKFALLTRARTVAIDVADIETASAALEKENALFEIDVFKLAQESLIALSKAAATPAQRQAAYAGAKTWAHRAMAADRFDAARTLGDLCLSFARGTSDPIYLKEAALLILTIRETEPAAAEAKAGLQALAQNPDDPAANLKVGVYRCYFAGDWRSGLQNLVKCSDKALADLARLELAAPASPDDQSKIADAWWDIAQSLSNATRPRVQEHAAKFYHAALPSLTGLSKAKAEKRIADSGYRAEPAAAPAGTGDALLNKYLAKIPRELLPLESDTPAESAAKSASFQKWIAANKLLEKGAADIAVTAKFLTSAMQSTPRDPAGELAESPHALRYLMRFQIQGDASGTPVTIVVGLYKTVTGKDDPAYKTIAEIEKAGAGVNYQITARITSTSAFLSKGGSKSPPYVGMTLSAATGEFTIKAAP